MPRRPRFAAPLLTASLLIAALLTLPACATLGESSSPGEDERPPPREEPPAEEPPAEESPGEETPTGDAGEETAEPRTVRGFRIQILTTDDKEAADQRAAEAESQWGGPVEVAWKAPYYRVRVGAFPSRGAAQSRLRSVQEQYPDAFLVPDMVTIYPN